MAVTFPGRVEAKYTLPSSADVTLTPANYSSGQTVSLAAGSYYHSAAGSVSGGLATWQTALNAACSGYARTAASAATMLGYGDFTSGAAYLFQEASGNPASTYGSPASLTANSLTYSNAGPASAGDLAIGFDGGTDYADGGDVFDITGTDDAIFAWIAYISAAPASTKIVLSKLTSGAGWQIKLTAAGNYEFQGYDSGPTQLFLASVAAPIAGWHVVIATIDRVTGKARIGACALGGTATTGTETSTAATTMANAISFRVGDRADNTGLAPTTLLMSGLYAVTGSGVAAGLSANLSTALTNFANAINSSYTVSLSPADGRVTIANSFWDYSLTWTSTTLRDLLGFDADIASVQSATGAKQARGVWLPDAPLTCDQHPSMVPVDTDARSSESPTGTVLTLTGNERYVHTNVGWMRVPVDRIRERSATYANASLEVFWRDCIVGLGDISWFSPGSDLQIWWNNAGTLTLLGDDGVDADGSGVDGWRPAALPRFAELAKPSQPNWVGQWDVRIPRLVSDG